MDVTGWEMKEGTAVRMELYKTLTFTVFWSVLAVKVFVTPPSTYNCVALFCKEKDSWKEAVHCL